MSTRSPHRHRLETTQIQTYWTCLFPTDMCKPLRAHMRAYTMVFDFKFSQTSHAFNFTCICTFTKSFTETTIYPYKYIDIIHIRFCIPTQVEFHPQDGWGTEKWNCMTLGLYWQNMAFIQSPGFALLSRTSTLTFLLANFQYPKQQFAQVGKGLKVDWDFNSIPTSSVRVPGMYSDGNGVGFVILRGNWHLWLRARNAALAGYGKNSFGHCSETHNDDDLKAEELALSETWWNVTKLAPRSVCSVGGASGAVTDSIAPLSERTCSGGQNS